MQYDFSIKWTVLILFLNHFLTDRIDIRILLQFLFSFCVYLDELSFWLFYFLFSQVFVIKPALITGDKYSGFWIEGVTCCFTVCGVPTEQLKANRDCMILLILLTPRMFPVWDFVVGIFAWKAMLHMGRVLSLLSYQYL